MFVRAHGKTEVLVAWEKKGRIDLVEVAICSVITATIGLFGSIVGVIILRPHSVLIQR